MHISTKVLSKKQNNVRLTVIELSILDMMADGFSGKEMAKKLGLEFSTIETYRVRICDKLECKNGCECVAFAIRSGIIN